MNKPILAISGISLFFGLLLVWVSISTPIILLGILAIHSKNLGIILILGGIIGIIGSFFIR